MLLLILMMMNINIQKWKTLHYYQLSTINYTYHLSTITYQLSTINYQLSTITYHLSTINYQLSQVGGQAGLGRQLVLPTPWLIGRNG